MTPSDENKLLAMRDYIIKLANATASFASRISYGYGEGDGGKSLESLKVIGGHVELQKLGVVPQTVFLKMSGTMRSNSRMGDVPPSRRSTLTILRTPMLSPGTSRRTSVGESTIGAPFASTSSSTTSISLRPSSRLQVGSTDNQKAAPAVGSSMATATGLLEAGRLSPSIFSISQKDLQDDFGPKVHEGPVRRRNITRSTFSTRDISGSSSARRIETNLIANLSSHSEAITGLAVSSDHMFFISSSDDKTVKVWDTARLERNVTSKPRQTYGQHHARVKCVCMLEGVHCFASAAEDGSLHVVRVHVAVSGTGALPKYNRLQVVREHRVENVGEYIVAMTHHNTGWFS